MATLKLTGISIPENANECGKVSFEVNADIGNRQSYSATLELTKNHTGRWEAAMNINEMPSDIDTPEEAVARLGRYLRGLGEVLNEATLSDFPVGHLFSAPRIKSNKELAESVISEQANGGQELGE